MALTENVTVLFTDLVSSTELASSLSPEAGDEFRRDHFSVLRQAVVEADGTEVKNLGDGIMAVFRAPSAALSCAVAMQQGVDRHNRRLEHPGSLRIGLSTGEATREADDYFGDPVIEAARLCARAEGGQILAADAVRFTAGRRNPYECRSLGGLVLKGLPEPIETVEVLWEPIVDVDTAGIPLPVRLARRPTVGMVGRELRLQMLSDTVKRVAGTDGREVLLVSGEAGLGKTTLVAEAARAAFDNGNVVLFGHCEEDLTTPYQLFAEALHHYVVHASEDQLRTHAAAHGSELARLVPELSNRIPDLPPSKATDADTERFLLFAAVVDLLTELSKARPVVVVLDDLHWADKGSLLLLRHLTAADTDMRVLVLGTFRDSELSRSHPLVDTLAALHRQSGVTQWELDGLDDAGVVAFMEAAAGHELDDAGVNLAHALYRETDGNPFFVGEVLRHLSETGAIFQDMTGRWVVRDSLDGLSLPDSVRVVIGARVGRLGADAERVLSMASVIGRDFDLDVLVRATKSSEDAVLDILEAAGTVALVRELADVPGRYSFTHALIRHTLYQDLGATRRARAHRRVGAALEELSGAQPGARVGELARHWTSATQPIDATKAIGYNRQAGDAALAALAPADASAYYALALDLYPQVSDPDPVLALDLAIGLGTAQRQSGNPAFRETLLDAARQAEALSDTHRLVTAALANHRGFVSSVGVLDGERVDILELALDRLPAQHPSRALVLSTLCQELALGSPLEHRQALADEALAIAEACGDDAVIVRVLNNLVNPLQVPSLLDQSLERTADALIRAERVGDPVLTFFASDMRAQTAGRAGDVDEVDRCIEIMRILSDQLDQPTLKWTYTFNRAQRAQIAGDIALAEQLAGEALQLGTDGGQPDAMTIWGSQMIVVNHQRGTMDDLIPLIEQMVDDAPGVTGILTAGLARAYAEAERTEDARRLLDEFSRAGFELFLDASWLTAMACYANAAIAVGDPEFAGPLFSQLIPWAAQSATAGGLTSSGPVSSYLGALATVIGRYEEADRYFTQSCEMCDRMGASYFAARGDLWWGQMHIQRSGPGDVERASELLTRAKTSAALNGYGSVESRASSALRLLGPA